MEILRRYKSLNRWQQIVIIVLDLILLLRLCYVWIGGEIDREYRLSSEIDLTDAAMIPCNDITQTFSSSHDRLNSLEFLFTGVSQDQSGHIVVRISKGNSEQPIYQAKLSFANLVNDEWKKVYIGMELEEGKEYTIFLDTSEECAQIPNLYLVAPDRSAPETIVSTQNGQLLSGCAAIRFGYLQPPKYLDCLVISLCWFLTFLLTSYAVYHFTQCVAWSKKLLKKLYCSVDRRMASWLTELAACYIIVNSSGISFQKATILVLYSISICAVIKGKEKRLFLYELCDKPHKKWLVVFFYFYTAFALVGQRIFIYPLNKDVTLVELFVFTAAVLWAMPVVRTIIYGFHWITQHSFSTKIQRHKTLIFAAVAFLLLVLPAAYCLYVFNPGSSSFDTNKCMITLAKHLHGATDWHPFSYVLILRALQEIWDSTYMVIFAQWLFWIYVMLELLLYLRKKGIRDGFLYAAAAFSGLNASNFLLLNTIWKDIPYALSMLWALVCIAKLSIDSNEYRTKWWLYLELCMAVTGLVLYRNNGIVPFAIIAVVLVISFWKNPKVLSALIASVILVCVVKGPVYNYFEVVTNDNDPEHLGGKYIGLSQDLLGVYYNGGEVSEHTLQMLTKLTNYNNAEYPYSPSWASLLYTLDVPVTDFVAEYIDTFVHNPILITRAIMDREDPLWGIFAGENCFVGGVNPYGTCDGLENWNNYYPERKYTSLYSRTVAALSYVEASQWISAIVWRSGLFTLVGMAAVIFLLLKRRGDDVRIYVGILAPIIGQVLSLLLSTGWSDFRYFWPLNLMNTALCFLVPVIAIKVGDVSHCK